MNSRERLKQARKATHRKSNAQCYVCGGTIKFNPVYVGKDLFRHRRCCPGSKQWHEFIRVQHQFGRLLDLMGGGQDA